MKSELVGFTLQQFFFDAAAYSRNFSGLSIHGDTN